MTSAYMQNVKTINLWCRQDISYLYFVGTINAPTIDLLLDLVRFCNTYDFFKYILSTCRRLRPWSYFVQQYSIIPRHRFSFNMFNALHAG